jgi:hypothetical protein
MTTTGFPCVFKTTPAPPLWSLVQTMKLVVLDISAKLRHRVHHISRSRSVADEAFGYPHVCKDELVKRDQEMTWLKSGSLDHATC